MAKKAMFTATSKAGTPLNVYGETCVNDNGVLTAKTLRKLMTGKD